MKGDRDALCDLIPHTGGMCLLDSVEIWDKQRIVCTTRSHRSTYNPLRSERGLSVIHVLEYGAQAMAIHGGLRASKQGGWNSGGYLVAVRNAIFHVERLDLLKQSLTLEATQLISSGTNHIYQIEVSAAGLPVAEARLTVMNPMETDR
jgi:predicted hotdog family 3-hydroxylacyl-ACP dehydratase